MLLATLLFEHAYAVGLIFILFPLVLWKNSWFIGYSILLGLSFLLLWVLNNQSQLDSIGHHAPGDAFGLAIFVILTVAFLLSLALRVIVYAIVRYVRYRKQI